MYVVAPTAAVRPTRPSATDRTTSSVTPIGARAPRPSCARLTSPASTNNYATTNDCEPWCRNGSISAPSGLGSPAPCESDNPQPKSDAQPSFLWKFRAPRPENEAPSSGANPCATRARSISRQKLVRRTAGTSGETRAFENPAGLRSRSAPRRRGDARTDTARSAHRPWKAHRHVGTKRRRRGRTAGGSMGMTRRGGNGLTGRTSGRCRRESPMRRQPGR